MSEPTLRLAQVLLVSMASGLALGATVPRVAIERDPTRPPSFTSAPGEAPTLVGGGQGEPSSANRLTTTVVAAGASFAVIDGHRVEEGDFLAGARVVKIDPASVTLRGRSGPYELRFYALPVKVEPGSMAELAARVGARRVRRAVVAVPAQSFIGATWSDLHRLNDGLGLGQHLSRWRLERRGSGHRGRLPNQGEYEGKADRGPRRPASRDEHGV